jgi:hypothetical protein
MEEVTVMEMFAVLVVLLVFGPPLVLVPTLLVLCGIGLFVADGPHRARSTFHCPVTGHRTTAEFSVTPAAEQPRAVLSCSEFRPATRVTCARRCLEAAGVRWSPPVGLFGRWALTSDGLASLAGDGGPLTKTAH